MTNQQQSINIINAVYAAYVNLIVSPFSNTKHIDAPSEEVARMRRLMGVLIDSAKIESAESVLVTDFMDMYLAKELARTTPNLIQLCFNGVKETFIPMSGMIKEYLSPAIFRHPAANKEIVMEDVISIQNIVWDCFKQQKPSISELCRYISLQIAMCNIFSHFSEVKSNYDYCIKSTSRSIVDAVIRHPKYKNGEYATISLRNGIDIDGDIR